jgi:hypothetical protein
MDALLWQLLAPPASSMIKIVIIFLLAGVVLSLFSSLAFLFRDSERPESKRALYALGIRITLAGALLLTVLYGFATGELSMGSNAPWHQSQTSGD